MAMTLTIVHGKSVHLIVRGDASHPDLGSIALWASGPRAGSLDPILAAFDAFEP